MMDDPVLPERYRPFEGLDGDWGNPPASKAKERVLVLRLSSFQDTEKSTSHLFLFSAVRASLPGALVDFSFLPERSERKDLRLSGLPLIHGWASGLPAASFDLILISNSFSLELLNLVPLLSGSGIPTTFAERAASSSPLLVLGGSNAFCTQALWEDPLTGSGGALVDAVFFGEGEIQVPSMLKAFAEAASSSAAPSDALPRRSFILSGMADAAPALSVPGLRPAASQAVLSLEDDLDADSWEVRAPRLDGTEATTARLTISRGCPSFCSFCMEGWERKPWREAPLDIVLERAERLRAASGASTLELASYNFNARSDIVRLMAGLGRAFPRLGLMSQRADILHLTAGLLDYEFAWGKRSFTIGVEGISARMRSFYRKGLADEVLRGLLESLLRAKAREIKLFFVLAGIETPEDLEEFDSFLSWLSERKSALHPGARLLFSSSFLMRMPLTPLEWMPLEFDTERLLGLSRSLEGSCLKRRFEYRSSSHPDEHCLGQLLVSGAPGLHALLLHLASRDFLHDGSLPRGAWEEARRFLWQGGKPPAELVAEKASDQAFPFGFVSRSIDRAWTRKRWEGLSAALSGKEGEASSCLASACLACGACPPGGPERPAILGHRVEEAPRRLIEAAIARQSSVSRAKSVFILAEVPECLWRAGREYLCARIARSLIAADRGQAGNLVGVEEALFSDPPLRSAFRSFSGKAAFSLRAVDPSSAVSAARKAGYEPLSLPPHKSAKDSLSAFEVEILLPGCPSALVERAFSVYLKGNDLPATFSRSSGSPQWTVAAKGLKRKILGSARLSEPGPALDGLLLSVSALPRFDPAAFLKALGSSFGERLPRIRFTSLEFDRT